MPLKSHFGTWTVVPPGHAASSGAFVSIPSERYAYGGQQQYAYDPHQMAYTYGQPPFQQQPYYHAGAPRPEHPGAVPSLVIVGSLVTSSTVTVIVWMSVSPLAVAVTSTS